MSDRIKFNCYKSVAGGFAACASAKGKPGTPHSIHPIWYGCQGETWEELVPRMRKLGVWVQESVTHEKKAMPFEVSLKEWSGEVPLQMSPYSNIEGMFRQLCTVGNTPIARVEEFDGMAKVYYLRRSAVLMVLPDKPWKPELEGELISFLVEVSKGGLQPSAQHYEQTEEDLVDWALRGSSLSMA